MSLFADIEDYESDLDKPSDAAHFPFREHTCEKLCAVKVPCISLSELNLESFSAYRCRFPVIIKQGCDHWPITELARNNVGELIKAAGKAAKKETEVLVSHDNRRFLKYELTSTKVMTLADGFDKTIGNVNASDVVTNDSREKLYCRAYLNEIPGWMNTIDLEKLDSLFPAKMLEKDGISNEENRDEACIWKNYKPQNIGIWASSAGCETPLHFDLCHGFLCQVKGQKTFLLAPPEDTNSLAWNLPSKSKNTLTSGIDLSQWMQGDVRQREMYPYVDECAWRYADLNTGDILYTPPGWWHHVTSVTKSLSVLVPTDPRPIDKLPWNVNACA